MFEQAERRKKELEATKLEASKTLKKDKRITRKHRSYGFCLKPTDRDQVDPEVQVRNCSFVACTSVEMFLVGLCLPLDPSSAHFDSVGGRRLWKSDSLNIIRNRLNVKRQMRKNSSGWMKKKGNIPKEKEERVKMEEERREAD
ncbi:hypothetical protein BLNAU_15723 [Blattamonas nauphoetae]|uniref:Uncharacterized protein n=1 Tax=Blattamonas nauphoetae TaxID=2049346 RepID=A0ABQ9X9X4_9EUKA|nr:hypothetical protein BLNAU_15723 [Blattamonas nauphoetae]